MEEIVIEEGGQIVTCLIVKFALNSIIEEESVEKDTFKTSLLDNLVIILPQSQF